MKNLAIIILAAAFFIPSTVTTVSAGAMKTAACEAACEKQKKKCYKKNKSKFARIGCDKAKEKCVKKCKK